MDVNYKFLEGLKGTKCWCELITIIVGSKSLNSIDKLGIM